MPPPLALILVISCSVNPWVHGANFTTINHDEGENVSLHCPQIRDNINWHYPDRSQNGIVQEDGSLFLSNVTRADAHLYTCQDAETNQSLGSIKLNVRSVPAAVTNLTVITHSVYALVTWELHDNGAAAAVGYPTQKFMLQYRCIDPSHAVANASVAQWTVIDHLRPTTSTVTVFNLMPNSTYDFRVQAVNKLGPGPEASVKAKTKYNLKEVQRANELLSTEQNISSNVYMK